MELVRDLAALPQSLRRGVVAIGNFDGVHRGHARLIARQQALAAELGAPTLVFTFDPHPARLLRPAEAPPPLTWTERKAELLGELGVDATIAYPTDEQLLQLSPEAFFQGIVLERLAARAMVEGPNFYFGRGRSGDVRLLGQLCAAAGLRLEVVEPIADEQGTVSSSRVRAAIAEGDVAAAARMLTRPYRLRGMVTPGAKRGMKLGFPTANLAAIDTLVPAEGVYAGRATADDQSFAAAIHIGTNPTFESNDAAVKVEVHLIDADVDMYGKPLEVDFVERLRGNQAFESAEALQRQLQQDIENARRQVGNPNSERLRKC